MDLYIHNVANLVLALVTQIATKSDTNFLICSLWKRTRLVIGFGFPIFDKVQDFAEIKILLVQFPPHSV